MENRGDREISEDRVFYRQHYDYRQTIKSISEAMTSMLDPDLIRRTLIGSAVKEMFLERWRRVSRAALARADPPRGASA